MIRATMRLVEVPGTAIKCLAGLDESGDWTVVLRKQKDTYRMICSEIGSTEQQVRSFLSNDETEANELVRAILETVDKPIRKPRRKRKAKR